MPDVARLLFKGGANLNTRIQDGSTPLHVAARDGTVEVICVLPEHGSNISAEGNQGGTPLHKAADEKRVEVVRVLLERGANICAEDNQGRTPTSPGPFQIASEIGDEEIMELLFEKGAKPCCSMTQDRCGCCKTLYNRVARIHLSLNGFYAGLRHFSEIDCVDLYNSVPGNGLVLLFRDVFVRKGIVARHAHIREPH